jgi:hypothetical protein
MCYRVDQSSREGGSYAAGWTLGCSVSIISTKAKWRARGKIDAYEAVSGYCELTFSFSLCATNGVE